MRTIALWLIGLIFIAPPQRGAGLRRSQTTGSSLAIAAGQRTGPQSGVTGDGWNVPHRNPSGGTWTGPQINCQAVPKARSANGRCASASRRRNARRTPRGNGPTARRSLRPLSRGHDRQMAEVHMNPIASCAQKGMIGKWPKCRSRTSRPAEAMPRRSGPQGQEMPDGDHGRRRQESAPARVQSTEARRDHAGHRRAGG